MPNYIVIPLQSAPGIQRDGTPFSGKNYIDGQWVRFYMSLPRKIGGYKLIDGGNGVIIRTIYNVPKPNSVDSYLGRADSVNYIHFDFNGVGLSEVGRTPAALPVNPNNMWNFDLFANTDDPLHPLIVGHVAPNANDVSNTIEGPVYYGQTTDNAPLTIIPGVVASGGILFAPPRLVVYGNNGFIRWCSEGDITDWPTDLTQHIANTKIIKMLNFRGAIITWSLDSLLSLTYLSDANGWAVSVIEDNTTVISPNSIVSYEQQFFWIGIDQFYFFNGIVRKLTNTMSTDWFFGNVNLAQRSKIWGMAVPRFKEIWWFYPRGTATECTHVIIYNVELQTWYDSALARAAGSSSGIFPLPMMTDAQANRLITRTGFIDAYPIWMHEYGYDKVTDTETSAIDSYFETHIIDLFEGNNMNRLIRSRRIEPDFKINEGGHMSVTVNNRMFPSDTIENGNIIQSGPYTFDANTRKVDDINSQGRLVSFLFESNELEGSYQMGKTLLNYNVGDVRP